MSLIKQEWGLIKRELATPAPYILALAGVFMAYGRVGWQPQFLMTLGFLALVLALAGLVDARTRLLPHSLNALLAASGLVLAPGVLGLAWWSSLGGAVVAWGGLLGLALGLQKLLGRQAVGGGDVWLVGALGAWIGLAGLPPFLLMVAVLGLVTVGWRRWSPRVKGKGRAGLRFAFGPVLVGAGWLALLYQGYYWQCIAFLAE